MAAYFQLKRDGKAVPFTTIDDEMCEHFGVTPDPVSYYDGWYDVIGLALALGRSFDQIRETWPHRKEQADWIEANFEVDSWSGR